ncbi:hypothetical protein TNCV_3954721 [Trichonephila clavipes]|nr:hypothetical protein TNCV_3954721 [Trichonephila clavipes]
MVTNSWLMSFSADDPPCRKSDAHSSLIVLVLVWYGIAERVGCPHRCRPLHLTKMIPEVSCLRVASGGHVDHYSLWSISSSFSNKIFDGPGDI